MIRPIAQKSLDDWRNNVLKPAKRLSEGKRIVKFDSAEIEYEIAILPDGTVALRFAFAANCAKRWMSSPFVQFPNRDLAIKFLLSQAVQYFSNRCLDHECRNCRAMIHEASGLFFIEPPVTPEAN